MVAASHLLIPIQSSYFALEGTDDLLETFEKIRARPNPAPAQRFKLAHPRVTQHRAEQVLDIIRVHSRLHRLRAPGARPAE